jgi:hypothetical protein
MENQTENQLEKLNNLVAGLQSLLDAANHERTRGLPFSATRSEHPSMVF